MDDGALVAAMVSGDQRGLEGAYRSYADRVYTYCRGLLRDPDAAADALHDTFVVASQRAGQLRDPGALRPWLYAIARDECRRQARRRARQVPPVDQDQVSADPAEPEAQLRTDEVRKLVWAAAEGLEPGDRLVFELSVRHELSAAELGAALGVTPDRAHARLSRVRSQLERALGALLVARTGAEDCAELATLLRGWDGVLTALVRGRVAHHIEVCPTCEARQREQSRPTELLSGYAGLPFLVAPAEVWPRLELTGADPGHQLDRQQIARRAGRFRTGTGFPPSYEYRRRRLLGAAALGVTLLLATGAATAPQVFGADPPETAAVSDTPPAGVPAPPSSPAASSAAPSPTPSLTGPPATSPAAGPPPSSVSPPVPSRPPPGPTPSASPPASPGPGPSHPPPPPPLTVRAAGDPSCVRGSLTLSVVSSISDGTIATAHLTWSTPSDKDRTEMKPNGRTAEATIGGLNGTRVTWQVTVTTTDGRSASTTAVEDRC